MTRRRILMVFLACNMICLQTQDENSCCSVTFVTKFLKSSLILCARKRTFLQHIQHRNIERNLKGYKVTKQPLKGSVTPLKPHFKSIIKHRVWTKHTC